MDGIIFVYTGGFIVYGLMEVLGLMPQEIKSAGITLSGLFGAFYGDLVWIQYLIVNIRHEFLFCEE